jgi:integration host factor subunit beta
MPYSNGEALHTKTRETALNKAHLIEKVHGLLELPRREAAIIVDQIFDSMVQALRRGEKVEIRRFGTFHLRQRGGRLARNPRTGAPVEVPPKKIPYFRPSEELRKLVEGI